MPCEPYKEALSEAAAGAPASSALRSHLIVCADCRAALAEEQALYASIDAGLRTVANAEVPASLIPSVRARLDERAPRQRWLVPLLAPIAAALVLGVFILRSMQRPTVKPATPAMTAAVAEPGAQGAPTSAKVPTIASSGSLGNVTTARVASRPLATQTQSRPEAPQVLVAHDQEVLLAGYAEQLQGHRFVRLTAELIPPPSLEPREVAPIQIAPLDVKPLEDADSR